MTTESHVSIDRSTLLERYRTGIADLEAALAAVTDIDLDRPQPAGEWTARQVVHHLADSESMAYIRLRRLIAEDDPVIHGYDEPEWARRLHYDRPIDASVAVVRAVRAASLQLLESLTPSEWARTGTHSESGSYSVERWLEIYADHTHDHADQIRRARRGEG
ncbi:MAG: DinB family protein [Chloroflexota bacterium]